MRTRLFIRPDAWACSLNLPDEQSRPGFPAGEPRARQTQKRAAPAARRSRAPASLCTFASFFTRCEERSGASRDGGAVLVIAIAAVTMPPMVPVAVGGGGRHCAVGAVHATVTAHTAVIIGGAAIPIAVACSACSILVRAGRRRVGLSAGCRRRRLGSRRIGVCPGCSSGRRRGRLGSGRIVIGIVGVRAGPRAILPAGRSCLSGCAGRASSPRLPGILGGSSPSAFGGGR